MNWALSEYKVVFSTLVYYWTSSSNSKHMHFNSFLDRTTFNHYLQEKIYGFLINIIFSYSGIEIMKLRLSV